MYLCEGVLFNNTLFTEECEDEPVNGGTQPHSPLIMRRVMRSVYGLTKPVTARALVASENAYHAIQDTPALNLKRQLRIIRPRPYLNGRLLGSAWVCRYWLVKISMLLRDLGSESNPGPPLVEECYAAVCLRLTIS